VTSVFTAASRMLISSPARSQTASSSPTFAFELDGLHLNAWIFVGVSARRNWFGRPPARFFPTVRATTAASGDSGPSASPA
jgi:hypothetical protein